MEPMELKPPRTEQIYLMDQDETRRNTLTQMYSDYP